MSITNNFLHSYTLANPNMTVNNLEYSGFYYPGMNNFGFQHPMARINSSYHHLNMHPSMIGSIVYNETMKMANTPDSSSESSFGNEN
jgi:hypothetical protein